MSKPSSTTNDRRLKTYKPKVRAINALEPVVAALSDEELRARTDELRAKIAASSARSQTSSNGRRSAAGANDDIGDVPPPPSRGSDRS